MADNLTKLNINPIDWATRDTGFIPGDGELWFYYNNSAYPNTVIYLIGDGTNTIDNLTVVTPMNDQVQSLMGNKTLTGSFTVIGNVFSRQIQIDNGLADGGDFILSSSGASNWQTNNYNGAYRRLEGANLRFYQDPGGAATFTGNLTVGGTLAKAAGTFDIPHVLPELNNATGLRHSFVESPIISNVYYDTVKLKKGKATVNIDKNFNMAEGTLLALNTDLKAFTSNENSFVRTKCELIGNEIHIEAEDSKCEDIIYWEVKGRRHDKYIMEADITDKDGKLIVEYEMGKTLEDIALEKEQIKKDYKAKAKKTKSL